MLPDGDGRDLCRELRTRSDVPIVMLTARGEEVDRIVGLELGADDYIVKPFSAGELVARIRAIQRRGRAPSARRAPITVGAITLDPSSRAVTKDGESIELAAKEFDLLKFLMSRAGEVVGREEIMDEVWDPHWFGPTKTLDVHISWLRKKIEDEPSSPTYITTVRGVGFRFAAPGVADEGPHTPRRVVRLRLARGDRGAHGSADDRDARPRSFRARGLDAHERSNDRRGAEPGSAGG